ncbi:hypothetical protein J5751_03960 [bacterium]|nr:hypothetical protein [bacterium]
MQFLMYRYETYTNFSNYSANALSVRCFKDSPLSFKKNIAQIEETMTTTI